MAQRKLTEAPWTNAEVEQLNAWQQAGYVHPFTCGRREEHDGEGILVATPNGWICPHPDCNYTQRWAHKYMLNVPPNPFPTGTPDDVSFT